MNYSRSLILMAALTAGTAGTARAVSIGATFSSTYTLTTINRPASLVPGFGVGGITFDANDPNALLVAEYSSYISGTIFASGVTRDAVTHSVTGFTGTWTSIASTPFIDGGLTYGPGGYLYFTQYPNNTVGELKPGDTSASYTESLPGVTSSTGGLSFVPAAFSGAGRAAISSYGGSSICSAPVTLQGDGSYSFGTCTGSVSMGDSVEGIQYVAAGTPGFNNNSILVTLYQQGSVLAYQVDSLGLPIVATGTTLVSGFSNPEGIAVDPTTGDILVSSYGAAGWVILHASNTPEPGTWWLVAAGLCSVWLKRRRGR